MLKTQDPVVAELSAGFKALVRTEITRALEASIGTTAELAKEIRTEAIFQAERLYKDRIAALEAQVAKLSRGKRMSRIIRDAAGQIAAVETESA